MALTANEYKRNYLVSEDAVEAKAQLEAMVLNPMYNTRSFYTPQQEADFSFVEKHLAYLSEHPKLSTQTYLANLRLMTKARS